MNLTNNKDCTITNNGTIYNKNKGLIITNCHIINKFKINNDGFIYNLGTIDNNVDGIITNNKDGTIKNFNTINNNDTINNYGDLYTNVRYKSLDDGSKLYTTTKLIIINDEDNNGILFTFEATYNPMN
jgi:hypothetical protein